MCRMEIVRVLTSNKGNDKVCFKGHMYIRKHVGKIIITWRCVKNSSIKCRGRMKTALDLSNPTESHGHCHESSDVKILANECVNEMKKKAQESLDKPNQVTLKNIIT